MIIETTLGSGIREYIDTNQPRREPAWLRRVRWALFILSNRDGDIKELYRLGRLYANDGNWRMAGMASGGIVKLRTLCIVKHDRILTGRE